MKTVENRLSEINYEQILASIYEFGGKDEPMDNFIVYLNTYGVTQNTISKMLNISIRQVRNALSDKK